MAKLFQIHEDDLADLERLLPNLADALARPMFECPESAPRLKTAIRRVKEIISNVRWNYGPIEIVEIILAGDEPPDAY